MMPGIVEILGSGTSTGVPTMGCACRVCTSNDRRDRRLRVSITITANGKTILVDTTPDLREQYLRAGQPHIDGIIYTHHHFDHIGGFDDVRGLNFRSKKPIDIYGMEETLRELRRFFPYAFTTKPSESSAPRVVTHTIDLEHPFTVAGLQWTPLLLEHGPMNVLGLRTGNFAYCTDSSRVPERAKEKLEGVTNFIVDGLRRRTHPMHMSMMEATELTKELGTRNNWLTHIAHETSHAEGLRYLPDNVKMACDGLKIPIMVTPADRSNRTALEA